jgi:hypothetical protein
VKETTIFKISKTMTSFAFSMIFLAVISLVMMAALAAGSGPLVNVDDVARVKEHRGGPQGDLVEGEEHMRKVLLQWDQVPGALGYEVCHNCVPSSDGELEGDIIPVPADQTKAGRPVLVFKNAPLGINTFHVRASVKENEWGPWSDQRNFVVDEPGNIYHDEL